MDFRLKDKADIKTFILYMLMQIDRPIDMATLNDIVVQDEFVGQFDFMDAFYELCAGGAITKTLDGGKELFSVSSKGRYAAEMLEGDLLVSIKERAAQSAMRLISFERRGSRAQSELENKNGAFVLRCSVFNKNEKQMCVEISLESRRSAEAMKRNFDERPEFIYRAILGVLSGDINYLSDAWTDDASSDDEI